MRPLIDFSLSFGDADIDLLNVNLFSSNNKGYLLLGCFVISTSLIICMLTLLLMPLAGLHFCVGLDFVIPSLQSFLSKHHHDHQRDRYRRGYSHIAQEYNRGNCGLSKMDQVINLFYFLFSFDSASLLFIGHLFLIIIDIFLYLCLSRWCIRKLHPSL
jgi:hypothetical protein